ncbi:DAK2 domain-containing protein [Geomicrobium sp. JCM 19037]|uniref:DAK2 domain-containing protein n=1 Tax=Geomicrobium sp. JCM 19037 TaxID=1460634 RepID=UPI0026CC6743|nr:DAK2 domain-containing protein [Geomicrobium sp. JCM 19037]
MSNKIDGQMLLAMFTEGAASLEKHAKRVDALNVFPVPDGDTGTNMSLTIRSGVKEMNQGNSASASEVAKRFSKGLLMGARGNSGVILSQLFRGFAKGIEQKQELDGTHLAEALDAGVETAYKAVMKPVEGTILTVAKDAAAAAKKAVKKHRDAEELLAIVIEEAKASLKRTPDLLPVLKEVGVVDSGGQGLVYIYEGMMAALRGETTDDYATEQPTMEELVTVEHHNIQGDMAAEDIEFGYCTEVMIRFDDEKVKKNPYVEDDFRNTLSQYGDSLLVVSDEDLIKIHIHAEHPGFVMNEAQKYGDLTHVKVDNMRDQHAALSNDYDGHIPAAAPGEQKDFALITVAMGSGVSELFKSIGVDEVIEGGQTMNPSTEQLTRSIERFNAKHIFLIPNNSNIIMTAEQAAEVSDKDVRVIPTKSVPQGLSALFAFNGMQDVDQNQEEMTDSIQHVRSGQVTTSIRDTSIEGIDIKKDDYMGLVENKIVSAGDPLNETLVKVTEKMIDEDTEMVTIISGEDAEQSCTDALIKHIESHHPDVETEVHEANSHCIIIL